MNFIMTPNSIMQKIYILIDDGNDRPVGTTLIKERAELLVKLSYGISIMEMEVESYEFLEPPEGHCAWSVKFYPNTKEVSVPIKLSVAHMNGIKIPSEQFFEGFNVNGIKYPSFLRVFCWAVDEEDVRKVAIERVEEWEKLNNIT